MERNPISRIIFGVITAILFIAYSYMRISTSPHSKDLDTPAQAAAPAVSEAAETPSPAESAPEVTPQPTPEPTPDPLAALPQVDLNDWSMVLVNADHLLDESFAPPELAYVSDSQCPVDSRIAQALTAFTDACRAEGIPVYLSSGYRPYSEQMYLFNRKLSQGYTEESARTIVAYPGSSEHQTGLCCDITDYYRESKSWEALEPTPTFQWLSAHCAEYGFVLRYPKDKSGLAYDGTAVDTVTGIIYEPWHFRYVGVEAATYIMENGLCLEEFVELYAQKQ